MFYCCFVFFAIIFMQIFSVHKPKRNNFRRRPVVVPSIFHTVMADLIDYRKFSRQNNGYKYILVMIDAFSRFAWTRPLKSKRAEECAAKMDDILSNFQYNPVFFTSDKGNEFMAKNEFVKRILVDKYKMGVYPMTGRTKGSIVERYNRTLKTRIQRYFTEKNTKRWVDVLGDFTRNINNSYNRSIGMKPVEVSLTNVNEIRERLYNSKQKDRTCHIQIGDVVRIPRGKNRFSKGYEQSEYFCFV